MSTIDPQLIELPHRTMSNEERPTPSGKVIHVAFGSGGGRIREAPQKVEEQGASRNETLFTRKEASRLLGVDLARLRKLEVEEVVTPSSEKEGEPAYTFGDLIALRAMRNLLAERVRVRDVKRAVFALRQALPKIARPLSELRIVTEGRKLVVRGPGGPFEPVTRQMVLDFARTESSEIVHVLHRTPSESNQKRAYELYAEATALDEDPESFDKAEALYKRAVELDPSLSLVLTNLGNIRFRRGDTEGAESYYRKAIQADEHQPEAQYNLGYLFLERGQAREAATHFEKAILQDPSFADAHYNLAMAYEQAGDRARARVSWRRYLEIEPTGTWADIARQHL